MVAQVVGAKLGYALPNLRNAGPQTAFFSPKAALEGGQRVTSIKTNLLSSCQSTLSLLPIPQYVPPTPPNRKFCGRVKRGGGELTKAHQSTNQLVPKNYVLQKKIGFVFSCKSPHTIACCVEPWILPLCLTTSLRLVAHMASQVATSLPAPSIQILIPIRYWDTPPSLKPGFPFSGESSACAWACEWTSLGRYLYITSPFPIGMLFLDSEYEPLHNGA